MGTENGYQYNGKELDEDFGLNVYHYGARIYDPAIGRFTGVDPLAESFSYLTTYNYASNDPIKNIDLWGLQGTRADILLDQDVKDLTEGRITKEEYLERINARGKGALIGIATVVTGAAVAYFGPAAVGVFLVEEAAEAGFEFITGIPVIVDPVDFLEAAAKKGLFKGMLESLKEQEKRRAAEIISSGEGALERIVETPQVGKAGDFLLNGKVIEFKSLEGNSINVNTGITRLKDGTKKPNVEIIDLDIRAPKGTPNDALEIYQRFKGTEAGKSYKGQVRIITDEGMSVFN